MEIFWNTIAKYNENTWWAQIIITATGIVLTTLLYHKPTVRTKRSMKAYMVFLNGWIALVYYMMYCNTRSYHHIPAIFWGIIALIWLWDLFTDYTPFERNPKYQKLVGVYLQRTHYLCRHYRPYCLPAAGTDQSGTVRAGQARAAHRKRHRGAAGDGGHYHRGRVNLVVDSKAKLCSALRGSIP